MINIIDFKWKIESENYSYYDIGTYIDTIKTKMGKTEKRQYSNGYFNYNNLNFNYNNGGYLYCFPIIFSSKGTWNDMLNNCHVSFLCLEFKHDNQNYIPGPNKISSKYGVLTYPLSIINDYGNIVTGDKNEDNENNNIGNLKELMKFEEEDGVYKWNVACKKYIKYTFFKSVDDDNPFIYNSVDNFFVGTRKNRDPYAFVGTSKFTFLNDYYHLGIFDKDFIFLPTNYKNYSVDNLSDIHNLNGEDYSPNEIKFYFENTNTNIGLHRWFSKDVNCSNLIYTYVYDQFYAFN